MDESASDHRRDVESNDGVKQRLTDDDPVDVAVGGADRAQRGELGEEDGPWCWKKRLSDDYSADDTLVSRRQTSAAPAPVPNSQNDRLWSRNWPGVSAWTPEILARIS